MQVSIEKEGQFGRVLTIDVKDTEIKNKTESKIEEISKKTKIDGFRAGKVPLSLVKKKFGKQARAEVVNDLMQQYFSESLKENDFNPVEQPQVTDMKDADTGDVTFTIKFEIYPEIELQDLTSLDLTAKKLELSADDIKEEKEKLLRDYGEWKELDKDAVAALDHQVEIDFVGKIDLKEFEGGSADKFKLVLGSNSFIKGFEEGVVGMKIDEEKDLNLKFPDDYQAEELAGKDVVFSVKLVSISENAPAEANEDLAKKIGAKNIEDIDTVLVEGLTRYANGVIIEKERPKILDALYNAHKTEVPEKLLERYKKDLSSGNANPANTGPEGMDIEEQAKRAVILDLVREKIAKEHSIEVDNNKVYERIMKIANMFGDKDLVFKLYQENQYLLDQIRTLVLDEQISELILTKMDDKATKLSLTDIKELSKLKE